MLDNLNWMSFNVALALMAVIFGYLFLHSRNLYARILFFVLWILFIPNTIYLVTDLKWLPEQFPKLDLQNQLILVAQYLVLLLTGLVTFFFGLRPLEEVLSKPKHRINIPVPVIIFLANYLIAFGVVLGRVERINSWDVFTRPSTVFTSASNIFNSQEDLIFILLFGTLSNLIYFAWKQFLKFN